MSDIVTIDDIDYLKVPFTHCCNCDDRFRVQCTHRAYDCPAGTGMMLQRVTVSPNGGDI